MLKYLPILAIVLAGPAFAQGSAMSPPAPNGGNQEPQSANSFPAGATNMSPSQSPNATGAVGVSGTPAPSGGSTTVPTAR